MPNSPPYTGAYDWGHIQGMASMIEVEDKIYIYYGSRPYMHNPGGAKSKKEMTRGICLATTKRDRLVSVSAGHYGGYLLTKPLSCPGGMLHINAKTAPDGFIRAAVREGRGVRDGEWPEDWRFDQSVPFSGDSLDHVLKWKHNKRFGTFPDKYLRLHFWMEKADLFSFWFD